MEPNVKVKGGRYEIPVPLRPDIVNKIPNNFLNALERTMASGSSRRFSKPNPYRHISSVAC